MLTIRAMQIETSKENNFCPKKTKVYSTGIEPGDEDHVSKQINHSNRVAWLSFCCMDLCLRKRTPL
ncbi:MAG: hypothetical protein ACE5DM_02095, partial [Candidatus Nanoarchaeia archaeon]